MTTAPTKADGWAAATEVVHAGPAPSQQFGLLNPPVHRASTIVYDSVAAYMSRHQGLYDDVIYGLYGTQTTLALAEAVARLEGGHRTVITASGTAAITLALTAHLNAGDHLLVADTVYGPTRRFCTDVLARFGVEVEFFDPLDLDGLEARVRPRSRVVYMESPGSQTFEVVDLRRVVPIARRHGLTTIMDNTWATPLHHRPIAHGVDVSVSSATKYLSGHSDVMLGCMTAATAAGYERLKDMAARAGDCAAPDSCYLVHRGLRTLDVRLERHQRTAAALIGWLQQQPEVRRVLYPALPDDAGHAVWKRDFSGASGLFGLLLDEMSQAEMARFLDPMRVFKLGSSWGGYESLIVPAWPAPVRTAAPPPAGTLLRVHAGLEDPRDLVGDLAAAFDRLRAGRRQ